MNLTRFWTKNPECLSFSGGRIKRSIELDTFNKDADVEYITLSSDDLADLINYANEQLEMRKERKTEKSLSLENKPQYKYTRVKRESQSIDISYGLISYIHWFICFTCQSYSTCVWTVDVWQSWNLYWLTCQSDIYPFYRPWQE